MKNPYQFMAEYAENNPWKYLKFFWITMLLIGVFAGSTIWLNIHGLIVPLSTFWMITWYILYYTAMTEKIDNHLTDAWRETRQ